MINNHNTNFRIMNGLGLACSCFFSVIFFNEWLALIVVIAGFVWGWFSIKTNSKTKIEDFFESKDGFQKYINNPDSLAYKDRE